MDANRILKLASRVQIYVGASLRGRPFSSQLGAPTEGRP